MLEEITTFAKQDPGRRSFLELPLEIKDNIYQKCFKGTERDVCLCHKIHIELATYLRDGHYATVPRRDDRNFGRTPRKHTTTSPSPATMAMSLLSTCHAIYTEGSRCLYQHKHFMLEHRELVYLPLNIKAQIRHLDTSSMYLAGIIWRSDDPRSSIWLNEIWHDIMLQFIRLESITFFCGYNRMACLLVQISNAAASRLDYPEIIIEMTIYGTKREESQGDLLRDDWGLDTSESRFYMPRLKKVIITAEFLHQDRMVLERLDLVTHKLWHEGKRLVRRGRTQHTYRLVKKGYRRNDR